MTTIQHQHKDKSRKHFGKMHSIGLYHENDIVRSAHNETCAMEGTVKYTQAAPLRNRWEY
jgi:hypothetical protein